MFLRCKVRRKDGKQHRYWSVVENTRVGGGRVVQRHVLYLGEINDTQELAWRRSIEILEDGAARPRTLRRPFGRGGLMGNDVAVVEGDLARRSRCDIGGMRHDDEGRAVAVQVVEQRHDLLA